MPPLRAALDLSWPAKRGLKLPELVRPPNSPVLIVVGLVLLLLAAVGVERAPQSANPYHVPVGFLAEGT